jgi:hypothetical protein
VVFCICANSQIVSWIPPPSCVGIRQDDSIIRAEEYQDFCEKSIEDPKPRDVDKTLYSRELDLIFDPLCVASLYWSLGKWMLSWN